MERRSSNTRPRDRVIHSRSQRFGRTLAARWSCCIATAGLAAIAPAALAQTPQPPPSPAAALTTVGIFLTAIHDIDPSRDTFLADFYVWTWSPAYAPDPLANVTVTRAITQRTLYEWKYKFGDQLWSLRKYRCEVINDWNLANFPFDSHVLAIAVVPNSDHYISPSYQVDKTNSGMARDIAPHGWRATSFEAFTKSVAYGSNFGDPKATVPYHYNAVAASFLLTRKPWQLFLKLMAGAYLAAGAALLGCYMKTNQPPIFSGRMGLQIACLFAAILNHRDIGRTAGQNDAFMLPDALQLLTYVLIFASLGITLRSRSLSELDQVTRAVTQERRMTLLLALIYITLNVVLIWGALAAAPESKMVQLFQIGD
jgi:hypothetical protein